MLLPDINDPNRNVLREMWNRLSALPGGRRAFSKFVGMAAPYTGTIHAHVEELGRRADGSGFCKVSLEDRRSVRNHLNSIHAIALANLAEVAGNLALAYTQPDDARFIVKGFDIEYLKKARGKITAHGQCPPVPTSERAEYAVEVVIRDEFANDLTKATLRTLVGPKRG
ncbi:MAG: DUF4442 domain-containing protein [Myxococcales bacterium]|nr:DUF4442 domain-containing protein [Myxococcales bacterium]